MHSAPPAGGSPGRANGHRGGRTRMLGKPVLVCRALFLVLAISRDACTRSHTGKASKSACTGPLLLPTARVIRSRTLSLLSCVVSSCLRPFEPLPWASFCELPDCPVPRFHQRPCADLCPRSGLASARFLPDRDGAHHVHPASGAATGRRKTSP